MKAIVQDRYGPPDVLHLEDIEEPIARADEVLVRVLAASAFIGDWHVATGLPYAIRAVSGLRAPIADLLPTPLLINDGFFEVVTGNQVRATTLR